MTVFDLKIELQINYNADLNNTEACFNVSTFAVTLCLF